jgi:putative DNA primase/helicase
MPSTVTIDELAAHLNLKNCAGSWRGNCPCCGYGNGAFSIYEGKDGRTRFWCANGCHWRELNETVREITGGKWTPPKWHQNEQESAAQREHKRKLAEEVWNYCQPAAGTDADTYLTRRGLPGLASSQVLRFAQSLGHPNHECFATMVARVTDVADNLVGVHRTYLGWWGHGKANVTPSKASLGPIFGGAIRLDPVAPEIVVGEGIESSASAGRLLQLPAWAAICAGNLGRSLVLPPVRKVVIAADHDPPLPNGKRPGQDAARAAWFRWRAEGREVQIVMPDCEGQDFNDILIERQAKEAV